MGGGMGMPCPFARLCGLRVHSLLAGPGQICDCDGRPAPAVGVHPGSEHVEVVGHVGAAEDDHSPGEAVVGVLDEDALAHPQHRTT